MPDKHKDFVEKLKSLYPYQAEELNKIAVLYRIPGWFSGDFHYYSADGFKHKVTSFDDIGGHLLKLDCKCGGSGILNANTGIIIETVAGREGITYKGEVVQEKEDRLCQM